MPDAISFGMSANRMFWFEPAEGEEIDVVPTLPLPPSPLPSYKRVSRRKYEIMESDGNFAIHQLLGNRIYTIPSHESDTRGMCRVSRFFSSLILSSSVEFVFLSARSRKALWYPNDRIRSPYRDRLIFFDKAFSAIRIALCTP